MEIQLKQKSLKFSKRESISSNLSFGFGDHYIVPFAIFLKATPLQLGYFTSFQNLIGPLGQILTQKLLNFFSRKRIIITSLLTQTLILFLISLISYFYFPQKFLIYFLISLWTLYIFFGNFSSPAFISWIGDLSEAKKREEFLAQRNSWGVFSFIFAMILGGIILDFFKERNLILNGFLFIFSLSVIFKIISVYLFSKQHEPKFYHQKQEYFSFFQFLKEAPKRNYGKFALFLAFFVMSVNISAPYYSLYILRDLKFSYFQFMIAQVASALASFIFFPFWAKIINVFGNISVIRVTGNFLPLIAFFYLFTPFLSQPFSFGLIVFTFFFSGTFWSGFNLASLNFLYDSVSSQKRVLCSAYSSLLNGIGVLIGAFGGGKIIDFFYSFPYNSIIIASFVSGFLRFLTVIVFFKFFTLKEKRELKEKPEYLFFYLMNEVSEIPFKILTFPKRLAKKLDILNFIFKIKKFLQ